MRLPRFYPILDRETAIRHDVSPVAAAEAILAAGARILQFRHKSFFSRQVFAEVERIAAICHETGALFVVNDRADLARMVDAAVHLGQDDLSPSDARRVVDRKTIVGFSTHNERQFREGITEPVDYLAFGPIFGTASKRNPDPVVGLDELRRLRPLFQGPLVAIGGITRANALAVLAAGADSLAVIGDLFPCDGNIRRRVEEWLRLVERT